MSRNAVLSRMETVCAEVMDMPEIFLDDDEDETDENDEMDEQDDESVENIPADTAEDDETAEDAENSTHSDTKRNRTDKDKGVSVKVNCEDKKQKRYAKWITRALKAAVNPIASRFNLNLKVNLDLNVANKGKTDKEADEQGSTKPSESNKNKPSPEQLKRRAELVRIKELEKENKYLEKVFRKIVSEYTGMKTKLAEKEEKLDEHQLKLTGFESKNEQLSIENSSLQEKMANALANSTDMQQQVFKLRNDYSHIKNELESSKKQISIKTDELKNLQMKLAELEKQYNDETRNVQAKLSEALHEKQVILTSKESEIVRLTEQLRLVQDEKSQSESKYQAALQEHMQNRTQMELRNVELMQRNRELNSFVNREAPQTDNQTTKEQALACTYSCPICQSTFKYFSDLQIHTENCGT
ncbi:paramyosin-like [Malaya genurostris]|uniref:paramyosin-like n=1 Tax=Malaya genurostris TaxID=325434 RepID=UPI0026F3C013|nr:paramyosin-like [Malaya genurostris]